jgi:hypothetical protein
MVPTSKDKAEQITLSQRNQNLLFDWFTLTSPYILPPENYRLRLAADSQGSIGGEFTYSYLKDFQFEVLVSQIQGFDDASSVLQGNFVNGLQYRIGGKLNFFNQLRGDAVSLSGRLTIGRESSAQSGYWFLEYPLMYEFNPKTAILFSPKAAITGGKSLVGLGLGVNYGFNKQIEFIAEVTPLLTGQRVVWSAGARIYPVPNVGLDLFGTNSTSQFDIGELLAEPGTRVGFGIHWRN